MASPTYTVINASEVDADSPLTAALAFRWTYNPISIMQGSPTARAAGMGVWVAKSPGGGDPAQTGILTDATDISLRLAPDGAGSVAWSAVVNCSGNLITDGSIRASSNTTANTQSSPTDGSVFAGKNIQQETANSRMLVIFHGECTIQITSEVYVSQTANVILYRKRSGTSTEIDTQAITTEKANWIISDTPTIGQFISGFHINFNELFIDCQNGDSFYVLLQLTGSIRGVPAWTHGVLTIASSN